MTDSEFRSSLINALNAIAANTQAIKENLNSLEGIHESTIELEYITKELNAIRKNGLPVDC